MKASGTAKQKALEFLDEHFKRKVWGPGDRLPTAEKLAKSAHVSLNSMLGALGEYRTRGILDIRRRQGIIVREQEEETVPIKPRCTKNWQVLKKDILSDIYFGQFRDVTQLPSLKEVTYIYDVCLRTVKKAISSLVDDGVLQKYGHTIKINRPHASRTRNTIAIIASPYFQEAKGDGIYIERQTEFIRTFERIATERNLLISVIPFSHEEYVQRLRSYPSIFGILIWAPGYMGRDFVTIHRNLRTFGAPIAIYDDALTRDFYTYFPQLEWKYINENFSINNTVAGKVTGDYLLSYGHKKVLYVTNDRFDLWSQQRMQGIVERYEKVGQKNAVSHFQLPARNPELVSVKKMYAENDATVWVGENDQTALELCSLLRNMGVAVPGNISIMGFDDSMKSLRDGLTSYNFDIPLHAHKVMEWFFTSVLVHPNKIVKGPQEPFGGYVVTRNTVKRI